MQSNYLPALQALLALHEQSPQKAIDVLQTAVPRELAVPALDFIDLYGGLYPVYMRGRALAATHKDREAAAEFEKLLQHRGLLLADSVAAVATLEMARAYQRTGETQKAKSAYENLLASWKNADRDIPLESEYARLQ